MAKNLNSAEATTPTSVPPTPTAVPTSSAKRIERITVSLVGRPMAVQVTAFDSVTGSTEIQEESGLYFLYTDHLGSVTAVKDVTGARIGDVTRFLPFGEYRGTEPTADHVTDQGFTGHKENREFGLTYMNARYYVPEIGRFASADTIVPDPLNPQSFNRYSYVFNRPLVLTDPSGHDPMWCSAEYDGGASCAPMVSFEGGRDNWSQGEMTTIRLAAYKIAFALKRHGEANSASEQFLAVYGGTVNFRKTGIAADNLGEATSQNKIVVNEQNDGATVVNSGTMWATHELGHAFNNTLSPNRTQPGYIHGQGLIDLATEGIRVNDILISGAENSESWLGSYTRDFSGYQTDTYPYIQNPLHTASEDFADMFSNYVHDSFAPNDYGQARYDFMSSHMSNWIALAVSNNE